MVMEQAIKDKTEMVENQMEKEARAAQAMYETGDNDEH